MDKYVTKVIDYECLPTNLKTQKYRIIVLRLKRVS
jgi:hypothetical protein